jgi:hypothetical protein
MGSSRARTPGCLPGNSSTHRRLLPDRVLLRAQQPAAPKVRGLRVFYG